ncbi:P-loop containing nucleoside triphosphate hydrolase protein [Mycotypha africana]|uniref:P-loop containing nucleoside triphosphate hydrolase protein n=1 Tax=Mycotypha africana TaxID=64632 RepID=UPI002301F27D|nr:P-loop containing nucleoside triphosphate hydrolase protein [Mycotypha africana]KAI8971995.1 P-loop containing nucleoside triphosphate hydrolase protein [Mycotypha africana]
MFHKTLIPAVAKLYSTRSLTTLTRNTLLKTNLSRSISFSGQPILPQILKQSKPASYALFHTQSVNYNRVAELLKKEENEDESFQFDKLDDTKIEPVKARFDSVTSLNPRTKKALERVFRYQEMSPVQEAVLTQLPDSSDMFVKAKTGTGKTLAFLIAALETSTAGFDEAAYKQFKGCSILVISPTRELANQIADEAEKLTKFYPFKVHCLVGGESKPRQIRNLDRYRGDIIVGTPGRLNDMLKSVKHFKKMCENLKVLVLDEADQLLDMGFKAELQSILSEIPEDRQTMLYSATLSKDIKKNLGQFALKRDYKLIDTVGEEEVHTNMKTKQTAIVAPYTDHVTIVRDILEKHEAAHKGKVIVFLPTTKSTMAYATIFKNLMRERRIHELHSRKSQQQRTKISDRFRSDRGNSVLFTSDVSARGVDYPGVSLVLQIGVPSSREQYIHRLGRTGRAGREGEGIILLAPFENQFLTNEVSDLPVQKLPAPQFPEEVVQENNEKAVASLQYVDPDLINETYTAYLGYYSGRMNMLGKPRDDAIDQANNFLQGLGVKELPQLSTSFLKKIGFGLKGGEDRNERRFGRREYGGRDNFRGRQDNYDNDRRRYNRSSDSSKRWDNNRSSFGRFNNNDNDDGNSNKTWNSNRSSFNRFKNNDNDDDNSNKAWSSNRSSFSRFNDDDDDTKHSSKKFDFNGFGHRSDKDFNRKTSKNGNRWEGRGKSRRF